MSPVHGSIIPADVVVAQVASARESWPGAEPAAALGRHFPAAAR